MTQRFAAITAWLAAGHAVLFGLFWLLLGVPESNVLMLAASALIVLAMAAIAAWIEGVALLMWAPASRWRTSLARAVRGSAAIAVALLLFGVVWYLTACALSAWALVRSQVDAWLMLHGGWTRTAGLHAAVWWAIAFVRYAVGLSLALVALASVLESGWRSLARPGWVRRALSPKRLAIVAAILFVTLWLPWKAVSWRPGWVSPTWQEPVFVALKLGVLYLVANAGAALITRVAGAGGSGAGARPEARRPAIPEGRPSA